MSFEEKVSLALFLIATVLSFARQAYQNILPGLKPAYVFLTCAIIAFFITDTSGNRLLMWKSVQTKIIWELIYVFAGGLAAGTLINDSGAAAAIGNAVSQMGLKGGLVTVFVIMCFTLVLSDVTSNTATAAVAVPIVVSIIQGIAPVHICRNRRSEFILLFSDVNQGDPGWIRASAEIYVKRRIKAVRDRNCADDSQLLFLICKIREE